MSGIVFAFVCVGCMQCLYHSNYYRTFFEFSVNLNLRAARLPTPGLGSNLLFGRFFAENCTKTKEIGPRRVPSAPGSATGFSAALVYSVHPKWPQFTSSGPKHHHRDPVPGPGFTLAASPCTNGSPGDKPRAYINYFMDIHSFSFKAVCM